MTTAFRDNPTVASHGSTVPTAEQLRRVALAHAESRGKRVATRRLLGRQIWHVLWSWVFPVVGMITSLSLVLLATVFYFGVDLMSMVDKGANGPTGRVEISPQVEASNFNTLQLDRQLSQPPANAPAATEPQNQ